MANAKKVEKSFGKLIDYCEKEAYKGWDPYDGLTSRLLNSLPVIRKNRLVRLIWIQTFKRNPINLRPFVGIQKEYNPKALGLFLSGHCILYGLWEKKSILDNIHFFIEKIIELTSSGYSGACWGYNFDWESRAFFQPKYSPTIVVSSYVANALLDAYELLGDAELLKIARGTCDFITKDLNRTYSADGTHIYSYSRLDNSAIFNASLMGSKLLSRMYTFTAEKQLLEEAEKSVAYCCNRQNRDGSWTYGELPFHRWIDSFHTGYNLECISEYMKFSGNRAFNENLERGFDYYIKTFFTDDDIPKYYSNRLYPIDIHNPAQFVVTLSRLGKTKAYKTRMDKVLSWTIDNMQSEEGFFYYQINKNFKSKIPYMRWSQAWMFYALSTYAKETMTI